MRRGVLWVALLAVPLAAFGAGGATAALPARSVIGADVAVAVRSATCTSTACTIVLANSGSEPIRRLDVGIVGERNGVVIFSDFTDPQADAGRCGGGSQGFVCYYSQFAQRFDDPRLWQPGTSRTITLTIRKEAAGLVRDGDPVRACGNITVANTCGEGKLTVPAAEPGEAEKYDLAVTITPIRSTAVAKAGGFGFATKIQVRNRDTAKRESEATRLGFQLKVSPAGLRSRIVVAGPAAKCGVAECLVPQLDPGQGVAFTIGLEGGAHPPARGTIELRVTVSCRTSDETSCANNVFPRRTTSKPAILSTAVEFVPTGAGAAKGPAKSDLKAIRARMKALLANTKWWKNTAGELSAVVGLASAPVPTLAPGAAAAGFLGVRLDRLGDDIDEEIDKLDDAIGGGDTAPASRAPAAARPPLPKTVPGDGFSEAAASALDAWGVAAVEAGSAIARLTRALDNGVGAAAAQRTAASAAASAFDRLGSASERLAAAAPPVFSKAAADAGRRVVARDGALPQVAQIMRRLGATPGEVDAVKDLAARPLRAGFPQAISDPAFRAGLGRVAAGFRAFSR